MCFYSSVPEIFISLNSFPVFEIFISFGCPVHVGVYTTSMQHDRMYELSNLLHGLHRRYGHDVFMSFHSYRYKFFVDSSPRGRHCRYGKACIKLYYVDNEQQELLKFLKTLEPVPPKLSQILKLLNET